MQYNKNELLQFQIFNIKHQQLKTEAPHRETFFRHRLQPIDKLHASYRVQQVRRRTLKTVVSRRKSPPANTCLL